MTGTMYDDENIAWLKNALTNLRDGGILRGNHVVFQKRGNTLYCLESLDESPMYDLVGNEDPIIIMLDILTLGEAVEDLGYVFKDIRKSKWN
jgi:hypothetical protein